MKNFTQSKKILMATAVLLSFSVSSQSSKNKVVIKNQSNRQSSSTNVVAEVLPVPFWAEDFGTSEKTGNQGTLANTYRGFNGPWEITDADQTGQKSNKWYVSAMEGGMGSGSCSQRFSEDPTLLNSTLHIGHKDDNGKEESAAKYWKNESSYTESRVESPMIDCSGKSDITVNFEYFCGGIAGTDFLSLYYFDGNEWSLLTTFGPSPISIECNNISKALWKTSDTYYLPSSANNNSNVRIGFRWKNDISTAGNFEDFSVAIDNVIVSNTSSSGGGSSEPTERITKINNIKKNNIKTSNLRVANNNSTPVVLNVEPFWTEDFGTSEKTGNQGTLANTYRGVNGPWESTDGDQTGQKSNKWYVSAMEGGMGFGSCSQRFAENNEYLNSTLHIGHKDDNGKEENGAKYWKNESSYTDSRIESPFIDCSDKSNIVINFDYFCGGIAGTDFLALYYFDGNDWSLLTNFGPSENTQACGDISKSFWRTSDSHQLPASADNNSNVRIAFKWKNDNSTTGNTEANAVAIDNIIVSGSTASSSNKSSAKTTKKDNAEITKGDLITVKAVVEKTEPVIYFTTTTEVNPTRELVIENSVDGKNFTKLTDVKSIAKGTSATKLSYTFVDYKAKEGVNYYRIKQTNADGKSIYSKVASVEFRNSGEKKASGINPTEVVNNNKIDVIDVRAVIEKNEPSIYFTTYSEKYPAKDIIIEGSKDGINYSPISKIKSNAKKDIVGKVAYTYTDANAHEGVNYYRIKQTNADGTVITSKVVSVDFIKINDKKVTFTVYPNPNSGQFTIDFSGIENNHEVQLVLSDMNDGREIYTTSFYSNSVESNKVDVNPPTKIPTGRYACSLIFEGIKNTVIIMIE